MANASAYTVTFNSTFGEFDGGATTNIVEYNDDHTVKSGEYKEPVYNTGVDSSDFITWYSEYDAKNRLNLDEISSDTTVYAAYEKVTWRWGYTGNEQTFALPITAGLQLHVWGAQGGSYTDKVGGYGGYATGLYDFDANQIIYINVGGTATSYVGGYNGGGTGADHYNAQGGGGATHIALDSGLLNEFEDKKDLVAIVAGGGGGIDHYNRGSNGGHGGGFTGGYGQGFDAGAQSWTVSGALFVRGTPGTQTQGGRSAGFGFGGTSTNNHGGGGGGGWYGGGVGTYQSGKVGAGGGGSGYIGNTVESTRHMVGFDAEESDQDPIKTIATTEASEDAIEDYAKLGNGYAKAELTRLNIRYINEFDNTDFTKDQYVGSLAQEFAITQRPGYTAAWYKGNDVWDFNDLVNFDTTLEVKYTPIVYNLTYDLGTGTLSEANPDTYTIESDDITLNNPTAPDYYSFLGWSGTDLTGNTNLTVTIPKGSIGNREYTANIAPTPYTITYNLDGGTNGANNPTEYNYESSEIVLARPTKEGHTFLGWSGTGIDGENNLDVTIPAQSHGDREYTAHWSINQYTATFDVNGGSAVDPNTITSDYGIPFGELPETHIKGYEFLGWFTEQTGGDKISNTTTMPAEDHTYYAHWEIINYTIEYDLGGEDMDTPPANDSSNPTSYTVEDADITLKAATPGDTWHYFVGWALDRDSEDGLTDNFVIDTAEVKNIKVYAIFQANPYTVTLDPENGDDKIIRTVRGDQEIGELPTPERAGYEFLGWFVGDKQIDEHFHPRSDSIAVARWEEIPTVPDTGANSTPNTGDAIMNHIVTLVVCIFALFIVVALRKRKAKNEA
ncbi:MAG: InlB B-repeat-containing protein [Candidatus Saccharibacteria bacterium]|nr:InlB B-repeat-containing protein [Candidatus Saccharibacteria bacterium]